jgi:putative hydrolase of the HAD superfamily
MKNGAKKIRGIITDWGGVLTSPLRDVMGAWTQADGLDWDTCQAVMRTWVHGAYDLNGGRNPVEALERGEFEPAEFERQLAARLVRTDGRPVAAEGLLDRMFAGSQPVPAMYDTIRAVRRAGYRTALLSNSWGSGGYRRADFGELFDTVVISGEVGMRKPEKEIFLHTARGMGLAPRQCVFIDDFEANVAAAAACGMTAIHHTEPEATAERLQDLLGVPLTVARAALDAARAA